MTAPISRRTTATLPSDLAGRNHLSSQRLRLVRFHRISRPHGRVRDDGSDAGGCAAIGPQDRRLDLERVAREEGMTTMAEDGLAKCRAGLTTIDEVFRVTASL